METVFTACPVFTGKVKSFDVSKVKDMPGVVNIVQVEDYAVAVVAKTWWQATQLLAPLFMTRRPACGSP